MNFLNPLFFLGALATAVPILLHLIKREHARKVEFPTLMFLRRISKRTIRYQKLRHLLLLMLRILAFLLIVLAFTRPYRDKAQVPAALAGTTMAHIIALDNSMSMDYQNRWSQAKEAAADIVRESGPGDEFAVIEFSDRTVARTQITNQASVVLSQIEDGVALTDHTTHYAQALKAAEQFALDAGTGKRIIHLISDFQKSGWAAEERDFRLTAGVELRIIDVGSSDFSNLAFREVQVVEPESGDDVILRASAMNFGTQDRKSVRISLFINGQQVAEKRIDIAAGGSQAIEFSPSGLASDVHRIVFQIDDPELTRDNRFYMVLEGRKKTPVPVIEGPNRPGRRPASFFLANALNIDALSPYRLMTVSPQDLAISGKLLIWNNAPGGNTELQRKLQEFVKSGGGLAVVLADSSRSADFNRSFGSWLPVRMADSISGQDRSGLRPVEDYILMTDVKMDHPIFQPFNKPNSGTFSSSRFFGHAKLSVDSGAEVLARFDNGDPALVSADVDKGRVLIFASSADDTSNDLPLKAVYAPFWQQMLRYLENFEEKRHWLHIGDTLAPRKLLEEAAPPQIKGGKLDPNEAVAVLDPDKERLSAGQKYDDVAVGKAGFYEIRSMNLNAAVAVNTALIESDLTHGDSEEMAAGWMSSNPAVSFRAERPSAEEQDRHQQIWKLLLIAALILFISELVLSNYIVRSTN